MAAGFVLALLTAIGTGRPEETMMRSDGEPAIVRLKNDVAKERNAERGETIIEQTLSGDSQANGRIERRIREVMGMFRTIKTSTERRYNNKIPMTHDVIPCMMKYAGDLLTRFKVHKE